jgi:serine/threonine protein kinase/Tol biopolymer transport system component
MTAHRWSDVERIFHAALEHPPEARSAFLTDSCAGDEALRREVESLLDETAHTGFLEQPALHVAAGMAQNPNAVQLTGQRIGVYQVQALLGKGGMGEVYRARDTRLDRDVAIKVLPRAFTADPDRLARFEREARVLASLNHPHIGMIHGLEEGGGMRALVLELVEGDTLADRIARGPVPIKQALTWARQIADALDAAHEKGIVHRDLKPANVKITPNDVVKVLDFGLARTYTSGDDAGDLTRSPTITSDGGVILGTAAYMSPEQARGQAVGKRADIWAFGCLLYEMLTGRIAFEGPSVSDTLAAVLHHEPDWTALPSRLPTSIATLLQRCLEKDVKQRRRDIGDVRAELDDALARPSGVTRSDVSATVTERRAPWPWRLVAVAAGIVLAVLAGVLADRRWNAAPVTPASPSEVGFERITDFVGIEEAPAVSPGGDEIAFVRPIDGRRQIWIRRAGRSPPFQVTHDDVDHDFPRWLPDASGIVYYTPPSKEGEEGTLWETPTLGGPARRLARSLTGADVFKDGRLATFKKKPTGIVLTILDRNGTELVTITSIPTVEFETPRWSPDGRSIASVTNPGGGNYAVYVADVAGGTPVVVAGALRIRGLAWLPDSSALVYGSSKGATILYPPVYQLRLVSRDGRSDRQLTVGDETYVDPDIAQDGKLYASRVQMHSEIWGYPVSGSAATNVAKGRQITTQTAQVQTPSVSPDGKEIAYLSDNGGHGNIWVMKADGSERTQITFKQGSDVAIGLPIWSPAGDWINFIQVISNGTVYQERIIHPDGTDDRMLAEGSSASWSPDGRWLYFQKRETTKFCVYKITVDEGASSTLVLCDAAAPIPSRNGLYYSPRSPGNPGEIFRASPENSPGAFVTGYTRSRVPHWPTSAVLSPDGRWLAVPLVDGGTTNIWALPTDGGPPRQLTDFGRRAILIARQVSWSPDGKFVYAAVAEQDADIVRFDGLLPHSSDPNRAPR